MSDTLIINYPYMSNVGGIEKYICQLTQYSINNCKRVIWLCGDINNTADSFKDVMHDKRVEIVNTRTKGFCWFEHDRVSFDKDENIVIIAFNPFGISTSVSFANEFPDRKISCYYYVPNTTGNTYFQERYFSGRRKIKIYDKYRNIFLKLEGLGALRFFAKGQAEALEKNYHVAISDVDSKIIPEVQGIPDLNVDELNHRVLREEFRIITVGRFDFPHKGYMLGLVAAYGELKQKYSNIRLDIIGFGPDENVLKQEINKLPDDAKKDITLYGEVAPNDVPKYMKNAHINISVAGGIWSGAECGVLSIPARNYCYQGCEVYGYLPKSMMMGPATTPGDDVKQYISEVIEMTDAEYRRKCIDSYTACKSRKSNVNPEYCFKLPANRNPLTPREIRFMRRVEMEARIMIKLEIIRNKLIRKRS